MDTPERKQADRRTLWLAGGAVLWAGAVALRLVQLQIHQHEHYARLARIQQSRTVAVPAARGTISDRNGNPLAQSVAVDSVFVNPLLVPDLSVAADVLAPVLDLHRAELHDRLKKARRARKGYLRIKRKITQLESDRLRSLRIEWIQFEAESQRFYPKGTQAAHLLGSVDHEEHGNYGIELRLDEELRGKAGEERMLSDVRRRGIESEVSARVENGANVTLSIDERIQFAAERELRNAIKAHSFTTGSVVVMNPKTGEILALASYPLFDPNQPPETEWQRKARQNVAISAPFEPGSVFKVFTIAAALETTPLRPESIIPCGSFARAGRVIHEAKHHFGPMPMAQVLEKSSNVGAIQIGIRVGKQKLAEYMRRFGFGARTGIEAPHESGGRLKRVDRWQEGTLWSVAFGHEVTATTLQLARAGSAIANGGFLVTPRLLLKKQRPGEAEQIAPAAPPVRILKPETSITMRRMMEGVVLRGTGKAARIDGYSSGGKTGSAQIYDFETKRYTHLYNSSFLGFAPVGNPAIVVVVTLNGAKVYGGAIAAPVFRAVSTEALRVLDVPKDLPGVQPDSGQETEETTDLMIADLGTAPDARETPAAPMQGPPAPPLGPAPNPAELVGPRVPNFQGKTSRAVVEQASALGLPVLLSGKGTARVQAPPAGSILPRGERVLVQFAR
ncbi:MAG: penicillin-binding protein [Bryobacteraceae bacterium]